MGSDLTAGGPARDRLLQELERLTQEGVYRRRRNVAQHLGGLFHTIREQRSNYSRQGAPELEPDATALNC